MIKSPGLGPALPQPPVGTEQALSDGVLRALAEPTPPTTVPELAQHLGVHANTVRARLAALIEDGLVERESAVSAGRGRPAHIYRPSPQARSALRGGGAVEEYRALSAAFAEHLTAQSQDPGGEARAVGRTWGRHLAARSSASSSTSGSTTGAGSASAQEGVVDLLEELRFSPHADPDGIALRTCPLLEVATRLPEVVCQVHRGLVEGALERQGRPDITVELMPFAEPGACRLRLG